MRTRFLDQYDVLLFDMNSTFMFGEDRFGPSEDYFRTYETLGGTRVGRDAVTRAMHACCEGILRDYETPARYDDFPSLAEAFRKYSHAADNDIALLEQVFAEHELGHVPPPYVECLQRMATTHSLGIVSNICARPERWRRYLHDAGLGSTFASMVFSSEGRSIKPSVALFRRALAAFPADSRVLFVGDSLERDVLPARALGLGTAWIAPSSSSSSSSSPADVTVDTILALETLSI